MGESERGPHSVTSAQDADYQEKYKIWALRVMYIINPEFVVDISLIYLTPLYIHGSQKFPIVCDKTTRRPSMQDDLR